MLIGVDEDPQIHSIYRGAAIVAVSHLAPKIGRRSVLVRILYRLQRPFQPIGDCGLGCDALFQIRLPTFRQLYSLYNLA